METDHEIILQPLIQAEQFSVTGEKMSIKYKLSPRNSLDKLSDRLDMTLVVDLAVTISFIVFLCYFLLSVGSLPR